MISLASARMVASGGIFAATRKAAAAVAVVDIFLLFDTAVVVFPCVTNYSFYYKSKILVDLYN